MKQALYLLIGLVVLVAAWWFLDGAEQLDLPRTQPASQQTQPTNTDSSAQDQVDTELPTDEMPGMTTTGTTTTGAVATGSSTGRDEEFDPDQFEDEEIQELLQMLEGMLTGTSE